MAANNKSISEIPNKILKLKKELNIKIIEPFRSDIIEFEDVEQFNDYINRDLEKYTALTTQKLNKMFRVPGYKITRLTVDGNKEIGLRKGTYGCNTENEQIKILKEMVETLINEVNRIDSEVSMIKECIK